MIHRIKRSFKEPTREGLSWDKRWKGGDKGLITCWEVGREIRRKESDLAKRTEKGELPVLGWKGGVDKTIKKAEKYGTLFHLAQWQGIRGDDLDIDLSDEPEHVCSRTGVKVIFTNDLAKYGST